VDAEQAGGAALVAITVVKDLGEQWDFHLAQDNLVDIIGLMAVQIVQVTLYRLRNMAAQRGGRCRV